MIVKEEFLSRLRRYFNLNLYEVKIWTALLSRGVSTAGELSDIANVPRSRSYDVLESLEKKGFVVMKLGKPIKYLAVPPKEVLERVKKKIEAKTEEHISEISGQGFVNLINGLQQMHDNNHAAESMVAIVRGARNIEKHISYLLNSGGKDILMSKSMQKHRLSTKKPVKLMGMDSRICVVDDNVVIFPADDNEVHPDYDLCVWLKHKETADFLKQLK